MFKKVKVCDVFSDVITLCDKLKSSSKELKLCRNYKKVDIDTNVVDTSIGEVDLTDAYSDSIFYKGWYPVETSDEGTKFRWASQVAYINLTGLKNKTFKCLISTSNPFLSNINTTVYFIDYNTKETYGTIILTASENSKPVNFNINTDDCVIMLYSDIGWIPALYNTSSDDWRHLAVVVEYVEIN